MLNIERPALDQLAALLLERAGLKINPDSYHSLRLALSSRMPVLGIQNANEYVMRLKELAGEPELRALLPLVTVGHTEFFRDPRQFHALERRVLPDALGRARRHGRKVSIWSAGCATGEEPYSLAIALAEHGARPEEVDLWATDLNQAALENAKFGRYTRRRLSNVTPARLQHFFRDTGEGVALSESIKRYVRFEALNLAAPVFGKPEPESLDLILCRNVIIYFDLPTIRGVMDRFLQALRPGGLLFLGYSESLFKVYDKFEMVEIDGAFVYRRKPEPSPSAQPPRPSLAMTPAPRPETGRTTRTLELPQLSLPRATPAPAPSFRHTPAPGLRPSPASPPAPPQALRPGRSRTVELPVTESRELGAEPTARTIEIPALTGAALSRTPQERLSSAVALMEKGDFDGALRDVKKLVQDEPDDLDSLLTLGNVHALLAHHDEAQAAFAQALSREPLCVEARLFLGMAALQRGRYPDARAEFGKALFLEPTLALGHYLIAQVHERLGDRDAARRGYRNAIAQLRHPQRVLAGHYPDMPNASEGVMQAARYALAALEEN